MPFEAVIGDFNEHLAGETIGGVVVNEEQVSEAVRFAIRDTMRRYSDRVKKLTFSWKPENKPIFESNFDPQRQLGLVALDSNPVIFNLTNTRIWGIVSAGSIEHKIFPKYGNSLLRFTGWDPDFLEKGNTPRGRRKAVPVDIDRSFASTRGSLRRSSLGREQLTRLNATNAQRRRREKRPSYPQTYIPSTKPNTFNSARSRHLGNATIRLTFNKDNPLGLPHVDHPGFEARNLTGMLLGTHGSPPGGDLSEFYFDQVFARLQQEAGVSFDRTPGAGQLFGRREFVVEQGSDLFRGGRTTFATSRFRN